ncbi:high mobility group protein hmg-12-like [Ptychodera flava]|uniref:high mobility group protein hmg-12-like n=1 Tax=Ptychodera flava TaxID=63121 RepID=UPI003969ECA9
MSTTKAKETLPDDEASATTSAPATSFATTPENPPAMPAEAGTSEIEAEAPKKKRGRKPLPPKIKEPVPEGMKRPKGRPRKHKPVEQQTGPKRPRGRPRKYPPKDTSGPKRARGRPRKSESAGTSDEQAKAKGKAKKATGKKGKGTGRGRGRPRKITAATPDTETSGKRSGRGQKRKAIVEVEAVNPEKAEPVAKKPRGKPLKKAIVEAAAAGELSGE